MKPALSIVVHGGSKVGKSTFGSTTPAPRLIIDDEYGSRFTKGRKKEWNYWLEAPPEDDGTWDTVIVVPNSWADTGRIYEWLASGAHPFKSVVVDSITEIQKRLIDDVAGTEQVTMQQWGEIWRKGDDFIRRLRDLIKPTAMKPLDALVIIALTEEDKGVWKPAVSGKLNKYIGAHMDIIGYMYVDNDLARNEVVYRMLIIRTPTIEAGARPPELVETYGPVIEGANASDFLAIISSQFDNNQEGN